MGKKITKIEALHTLPTRKRVAAYARVSCSKDEMLRSLAAQVSFYSERIQSRPDWEYAGVYADEALTGTKDNRPEVGRLLTDCRTGMIDLVLTKSISRFARNTVVLLETVRELKELGTYVYFEEQNIHTDSADGELMLTILAGYAQEESHSVSENCKWRVRKDFKDGKFTGFIRMYGNAIGRIILEGQNHIAVTLDDAIVYLCRLLGCDLNNIEVFANNFHGGGFMPLNKNPFTAPDMQQYFSSLSPVIQESIEQSGIEFESLDHLLSFVKNLERK